MERQTVADRAAGNTPTAVTIHSCGDSEGRFFCSFARRFIKKSVVGSSSHAAAHLEHDPEKWMPVFRKDHAPTKKLDHDPIQFDRIMV
ncbi:MAG TPA: hypothetical protein VHT03_06540 [Rhizomicrobium sp.]|nr:hypothetical protein [Rhizomicrobium sp.]